MISTNQLIQQTSSTLELSDQPAVLLSVDLGIEFANAAFRSFFKQESNFKSLINSKEQDRFLSKLKKADSQPVDFLLGVGQQEEFYYSKWKFRLQKDINKYVGFGEIYENEPASISEVADLLKTKKSDITDITRHLSANIDKFQLITDHITDVVCLHHPEDASYLYASPSVKNMIGYTPEEMEGRTPYEFFHPDFIEILESDHQRSAAGESDGPPPQMDVMLITKSGEKIWASVHSEPLFDENGKVALIISSSRDISARKAVEDDLKAKNTELNAFSYRTSHDLRSPLMTIMAIINQVGEEDSLEKVKDFTSILKDRVGAMDRLIHSIMDYAKNMNNEISKEPLSLDTLLDDIKSDYAFHENFKRLQINIDSQIDGPIESDKERIKIIFNCLLSNALDFVDVSKSNSMLTVSIKERNDHLNIVFEDNGIGIRDKVKPHIFDMFYRGDSSSQGAGLGLYLVQQCVQKLNGEVSCDSKDGGGTKFVIKLPV